MNPKPDSKTDRMIEREIEALLKVDPPPNFVPRLRARLAEAPEPSFWFFRKIIYVGAAAMAFAAALALLVFYSGESKRSEPTVAESIPTESTAPEPSTVEVAAKPATVPDLRVPKLQPDGPELLIPANEARAIRVLIEKPLGPIPSNLADVLRMPESPGTVPTPQITIQPLDAPSPITVEALQTPPAITEGGV